MSDEMGSKKRDINTSHALAGKTTQKSLDDMILLASQICEMPIALIQLVDGDHTWYASIGGIDPEVLAHTTPFWLEADDNPSIMVINDTQAVKNKRFWNHPLVTGNPRIRCCVLVPLQLPNSARIGTLCVMDRTPKALNPSKLHTLELLTQQFLNQWEMRQEIRKLHRAQASYQRVLQRLQRLATRDAQTSLLNRTSLQEGLVREIVRANRHEETFTLILMDLDDLTGINEAHGHQIGDALLKEIAARLKKVLRESDIIARIGGDEFVMVASLIRSVSDAEQIASKILDIVNVPFLTTKGNLQITCSMGVCVYPQDGSDPEILLRRADLAMYHAKKAGKNTYRLYMKEMGTGLTDWRNAKKPSLHFAA